LGDVRRIIGITDDASDERVDGPMGGPDELVERTGFTSATGFDERLGDLHVLYPSTVRAPSRLRAAQVT
jgi:hypothetical protein